MIEVVGLTKKYGQRVAIDDISFNVNKGEIVGFLGSNGAGKSSTMNILTGYISATSGKVKIDGIDILEEPIKAKKKIGYLPETPPLYMDMKVSEYLDFVFELKKVKQDKKSHLDEICELVKITDVKDRVIKNLSKGYKQRVGLAQALIGSPELLILDEPTVGLDPKQIIEIRNLVKKLGESHTVILSSHILSEIQAVCDKVIIINKGKIVANEKTENLSNIISADSRILLDIIGNQDEIYQVISGLDEVESVEKLNNINNINNIDEIYSFSIKSKNGVDIRKIISKAVVDAGSIIIGLRLSGFSLEDIFLKLTDSKSDQDFDQDQDQDIFLSNQEKEKIKKTLVDIKDKVIDNLSRIDVDDIELEKFKIKKNNIEGDE
ncbi:MAG: ATP-binding cassette domain-containing protein [Oscillospiraceae bacterium]|nr:ATP-binding cassette domain-containing protein [Oscillospiraceae bacterium]